MFALDLETVAPFIPSSPDGFPNFQAAPGWRYSQYTFARWIASDCQNLFTFCGGCLSTSRRGLKRGGSAKLWFFVQVFGKMDRALRLRVAVIVSRAARKNRNSKTDLRMQQPKPELSHGLHLPSNSSRNRASTGTPAGRQRRNGEGWNGSSRVLRHRRDLFQD